MYTNSLYCIKSVFPRDGWYFTLLSLFDKGKLNISVCLKGIGIRQQERFWISFFGDCSGTRTLCVTRATKNGSTGAPVSIRYGVTRKRARGPHIHTRYTIHQWWSLGTALSSRLCLGGIQWSSAYWFLHIAQQRRRRFWGRYGCDTFGRDCFCSCRSSSSIFIIILFAIAEIKHGKILGCHA